MNKYVWEITSFRQAFMALWRLTGNSRWCVFKSAHTLMHIHTLRHASMCTQANIYHRYRLSMSRMHPQPLRSTYCLRVKTCYAMGWVAYVSLSGICYQGFGLGSLYQVSESWTCAGSQMTLCWDEDLICEKPDSLTQVFFVLLASDACWRPHLNDEKEVSWDVWTRNLKLMD